jgi:pimeloyl-ACP methyl ester carboxylesterase
MIGWIIFGVVTPVVLLLTGVCAVFFCIAFVPRQTKKDPEALCRAIEKLPIAEKAELVRAGRIWLTDRPYSDVYITSFDGLKLHGRLIENSSAKGTIVMMHGYRSYPENDFSCVFSYYYGLGFNLLMPDQRAHGSSEGKYISFGALEKYDARDWCVYVAERFGEDHKVVLDGISMGATTVMLAASLDGLPKNVCGVIADCGFSSMKDELAYVLKRDYHLPSFPIMNIEELYCRLFMKIRFSDTDTIASLKKAKIPVLFLHGEGDNLVPCEHTVRSYEACVSEKRFVSVKDAGHGLSYLYDTETCKAELKKFLSEILQKDA